MSRSTVERIKIVRSMAVAAIVALFVLVLVGNHAWGWPASAALLLFLPLIVIGIFERREKLAVQD